MQSHANRQTNAPVVAADVVVACETKLPVVDDDVPGFLDLAAPAASAVTAYTVSMLRKTGSKTVGSYPHNTHNKTHLLLQAWKPSAHVWSKFVSPTSPQFLNQAPRRAQQLSLPNFFVIPHLRHTVLPLFDIAIASGGAMVSGCTSWEHGLITQRRNCHIHSIHDNIKHSYLRLRLVEEGLLIVEEKLLPVQEEPLGTCALPTSSSLRTQLSRGRSFEKKGSNSRYVYAQEKVCFGTIMSAP